MDSYNPAMHIWFVDDRASNRAAWLASFPDAIRNACELRVFASVPELFAVLDTGAWPDVMFVDYFLDGHLGSEVVDRLRAGPKAPPLIIAHSSLGIANEGMVENGAHLAMDKVKGGSTIPSVAAAFRTPADFEHLIRQHATQDE